MDDGTMDIPPPNDLEAILLKPLDKAAKRVFNGSAKRLPYSNGWDDLSVFNSSWSAACKYEQFKENYAFVVKNEDKLLRAIVAYKQYKATKARKYAATKAMAKKAIKSKKPTKIITTTTTKQHRKKTVVATKGAYYTLPQQQTVPFWDAAPKDVYGDITEVEPPNSPHIELNGSYNESINDGSSASNSTICSSVL